ncbi:hypothetical protein [Streptomyces montanisoli]|uniref:Uncharacterized protein n=1 Tax=Streptomyces montanisoli TaxID=2798581 RepID=A0A940RTU1_9ACTN|nr:hypothetical protein [Streptomyces montanisoli]MBP0456531.1 hypothetical protein [Streptomyces montanisoli]
MSETNDTEPAEGSEEPAVTDRDMETDTGTDATDGTASQKPSNGEEPGAKPDGWPGIS